MIMTDPVCERHEPIGFTIPESWMKFILERDDYRSLRIAWAIVDDYWYKGTGKSNALAYLDLIDHINERKPVGSKLEPARYAPASGKAYRKATIPMDDIDLSSFDLDL
jgi:hypothetical protein